MRVDAVARTEQAGECGHERWRLEKGGPTQRGRRVQQVVARSVAVELARDDAQQIVASDRALLERLVETLLERETLERDEFRAIFDPAPPSSRDRISDRPNAWPHANSA